MINRKNVDIKAEKEGKREKDKKIQKKSFTKGRGDGNIIPVLHTRQNSRFANRDIFDVLCLFPFPTSGRISFHICYCSMSASQ